MNPISGRAEDGRWEVHRFGTGSKYIRVIQSNGVDSLLNIDNDDIAALISALVSIKDGV